MLIPLGKARYIYLSLSIQLLSPSFVYFTVCLRFMFTLSYSYFHSLYCTFDIATAFWFYYTFLRLLYHSVAHSWSTDWKCILRWYPTANTSMGWHERVNGSEVRIVNAVANFFLSTLKKTMSKKSVHLQMHCIDSRIPSFCIRHYVCFEVFAFVSVSILLFTLWFLSLHKTNGFIQMNFTQISS